MKASTRFQLIAMIDKTMNCTADENQESTGPVYGDYIDGMGPIVFSECADLSGIKNFK
jgi:hypothetical protein